MSNLELIKFGDECCLDEETIYALSWLFVRNACEALTSPILLNPLDLQYLHENQLEDSLLKPVDFLRFIQHLNKWEQWIIFWELTEVKNEIDPIIKQMHILIQIVSFNAIDKYPEWQFRQLERQTSEDIEDLKLLISQELNSFKFLVKIFLKYDQFLEDLSELRNILIPKKIPAK